MCSLVQTTVPDASGRATPEAAHRPLSTKGALMKLTRLDQISLPERSGHGSSAGFGALPSADGLMNSMMSGSIELRERQRAIPTEANATYLDLECLAELALEPLEQVWGSVLTRGAVTVLAGEPGVGKSVVALSMAADVTRGDLGPQGSPGPHGDSVVEPQDQIVGEPMSVLVCSPHYERANVLFRRLKAADADLSLIQTIHGVRTADDIDRRGPCWSFQLDRDLAILEQELTLLVGDEPDIGLVVIDPFPNGLPGSGAKQARQLQEMVSRLAELAVFCQVAILLVCEALPLDDAKRAASVTPYPIVERTAQSVWVVERDPHDPGRRLLLPAKSIVEQQPPALGFSWRDGTIAWEAESFSMSAQQHRLMTLKRNRDPLLLEDTSELARATDWLNRRLADGPVQSWLVKQEAHENEISLATLKRAFCGLRGESKQIEGTRHHEWGATGTFHTATTGGSHARRTTGAECDDPSRNVVCTEENEFNRDHVEASCVCDTPVAEAATGATRKGEKGGTATTKAPTPVTSGRSVADEVQAHVEHVLEHQFEHVFHSANHGVSSDLLIGAQH